MLIKRSLTTALGVVTSTVEVQLDPLETQYAAAYAEPKIDRAGVFNFQPGHTTVAQIDLSTVADLSTPTVLGLLSLVTGLPQRSYMLQASGALAGDGLTNQGSFAFAPEVIGDFEFVACLAATAVGAADSIIGIGVFQGALNTSAGALFGWGNLGTKRITLRQRPTDGTAMTETAMTALADASGLALKLIRSGNTLTASWSVDGDTWNALGSITITQQALRVGLFGNSGGASLASSVFQSLSLSNVLSATQTSFTIAGSPDLHFIRSESPHKFSLDGAIEPEAHAKVKAWGETISGRLSSAKDTLMGNTNPNVSDTTETVEG